MGKARDLANVGSVASTGLQFRNKIINGAMTVDQRFGGAPRAVSGTLQPTSLTDLYISDRFRFTGFGTFPASQYATLQNVADAPAGFTNSGRVTVNQALSVNSSAVRGLWVYQAIEGFNFIDCWNQPITLSFWVKTSNPGTYSLTFGTNGGGYATSYVVQAANTWERKVITITHSTSLGTVDSTNGFALGVNFGLAGDSTWIGTGTANQWVSGNVPYLHGCKNLFDTNGATWQITGVQLEKGTQATPFEHRPIGTELALCQRYYWMLTPTTGNTTPFNMSWWANKARFAVSCPVPMRATPTVTTSGTASGFFFSTTDDSTYANLTLAYTYAEQGRSLTSVGIAGTVDNTAGSSTMYIQNSRLFQVSAEL